MTEYIEREAAKDELLSWAVCVNHPEHLMREDAIYVLDTISAANVAPVQHGRWIERKSFHAEGGISAKCSVCQKNVQYLGNPLKFCPNCGSKMDLED